MVYLLQEVADEAECLVLYHLQHEVGRSFAQLKHQRQQFHAGVEWRENEGLRWREGVREREVREGVRERGERER